MCDDCNLKDALPEVSSANYPFGTWDLFSACYHRADTRVRSAPRVAVSSLQYVEAAGVGFIYARGDAVHCRVLSVFSYSLLHRVDVFCNVSVSSCVCSLVVIQILFLQLYSVFEFWLVFPRFFHVCKDGGEFKIDKKIPSVETWKKLDKSTGKRSRIKIFCTFSYG